MDNPDRFSLQPVTERQPAPAPAAANPAAHPAPHLRMLAESIALAYIAVIAEIAFATGAFFIMFPELGALSQDAFTRPRGRWASAPVKLAITPVLTGIIGIFFTRELPYGYASVLLTVAGALAVIIALRSPIAPAISAGLLPLVIGVRSWWYPPGIMLGTTLLAALSIPWRKFAAARDRAPSEPLQDVLEEPTTSYWRIAPLMAFVAVAVLMVKLTGLRFILFPPLVVIGFEMFGHKEVCPWADRPLMLPLACFLTAAGGLAAFKLFGAGPLTAACAMAWGIGVLRLFDLHVPPALAVALLPLVMNSPTFAYPFAVGIGTLTLTLWFLGYEWAADWSAARLRRA